MLYLFCPTGRRVKTRFGTVYFDTWRGLVRSLLPDWKPGPTKIWYGLPLPDWPGPADVWYVLLRQSVPRAQPRFGTFYSARVAAAPN